MTDTDQSILKAFLLCLKRNFSETFKDSGCKEIFPSVHTIDTNFM